MLPTTTESLTPKNSKSKFSPPSGVGISLRFEHIQEILNSKPNIPWYEIVTDNFLCDGGRAREYLYQFSELYPLTLHGLGLSLGSTDPLDLNYIQKVKELRDTCKPAWVSEHLSWTAVHGDHFHDLLPLPYTKETVEHVSERILKFQDELGDQILIENVSSYLNFKDSEMSEWEFVTCVAEKADCYLLLDITNIYVNSINQEFEPIKYLEGIPRGRVKEIHLSGFEKREGYLLDAHSSRIPEEVWELFRDYSSMGAPIPTLIEWDNNIPKLDVLLEEQVRGTEISKGI